MNTLHEALGTLRYVPQFFVWRLTWNTAEGKFDKVPCYPDGSQYAMDAKEPRNWMSYDAAREALQRLRNAGGQYTLGFYLTESLGVWFLDIDKCVKDGQPSPLATALVQMLPGVLCEWSSSGNGLHLIGRGTLPVARRKKVKELDLELYTDGRGIAFGLHEPCYTNIRMIMKTLK